MFWENILEGFLVLIVGLTGVLTVLFLFYLIGDFDLFGDIEHYHQRWYRLNEKTSHE